jgi:hypothetical protein
MTFKIASRPALMSGIMLLCFLPAFAQTPAGTSQVTLYSFNKYRSERKPLCIHFQAGVAMTLRGPCDVWYGLLYAGDDLDWFQRSSTPDSRSVIRDLGAHQWNDVFDIPVIEPLPKLKPGEQRSVTIDVSGKDGGDGRPGAPGKPGEPGLNGDGTRAATPATASDLTNTPSKPKHDGIPKIDPMFTKAIAGHIYAIHVVDDTRDFYALFRVESLERGDNCAVSWRFSPPPTKPFSAEQTSPPLE